MTNTTLHPLTIHDVVAMAWMAEAVESLSKVRVLFDEDEPVRTCILRGFDPTDPRDADIRLRNVVIYDVYQYTESTRTFGELADLRRRGLVGKAG